MSDKTTVIVASYPEDKWVDSINERLADMGAKRLIVGKDVRRSFSENNNIGAREAKTDYILFLNSDTEPEPGFVEAMEAVLDSNRKFGIVGAKLIFLEDKVIEVKFQGGIHRTKCVKGTVQHAGIVFNNRLLPEEHGRLMGANDLEVNEGRIMGAVTGACMMVRREEFLNIGGFDEGFVNGWEDTDLCLRYVERGYLSFYTPKAVVWHRCGAGEAGRFDKEDDNFRLWSEKWHSTGRIRKVFVRNEGVRLDVGCGGKKKKGFMGMDKFAGPDVGVVFDLDTLSQRGSQMPFGDSAVEEIWCSHTLEHVVPLVDVINEFHRILAPWGKCTVVVPHAQSWSAWASPFHKRFFVPETFRQYFASDELAEKSKVDNEMRFVKPWHIEKIEWTQVPETVDPFSIEREIVCVMRPLK